MSEKNSRRALLAGACALFIPAPIYANLSPKRAFFNVTFSWVFFEKMSFTDAVKIEKRFVNQAKLLNINNALFKSGDLHAVSASVHDHKIDYHFSFNSKESYLKWENEMALQKVINRSQNPELYNIVNIFHS